VKKVRIGAAAVGICLLQATPAPAATQPDRVVVGGNSAATRGFSPALAVTLQAPTGFARGCCYTSVSGQWHGPRYQASSNGAVQNVSVIEWGVQFVRGSRPARSLARGGWDWFPEVRGQAIKVRHVVGGRTVGKLPAFVALDAEPAPGAQQQAAVALDLGRRTRALVYLFAAEPAADQAGSNGTLTVNGTPASAFNRARVEEAVRALKVEGSLPPRKVAARAAGKRIRGKVVDSFGHPVGQTKVTLLTAAGRKVGTATTATSGRFSLSAARSGRYRTVAALGGTKARSKLLRVR
jgi:hypothetical protein